MARGAAAKHHARLNAAAGRQGTVERQTGETARHESSPVGRAERSICARAYQHTKPIWRETLRITRPPRASQQRRIRSAGGGQAAAAFNESNGGRSSMGTRATAPSCQGFR